jgi:hypothetical protein
MTSMYKVDNFDEIILMEFNSIIQEFKLQFIPSPNEKYSDVRLVGAMCIIYFTYDRGELPCFLINPLNNRRYFSNLVYKLLYPGENKFDVSIKSSPQQQIMVYAELTRARLSNVILGDFSWASRYDMMP